MDRDRERLAKLSCFIDCLVKRIARRANTEVEPAR
jgi:hypothetical protein